MSSPGGPEPPQPSPSLETGVAMLGIAAVLAAQFAWVKPTNWGGFDEWTILSLVARGITDIPYANRPLELLFSLPTRLAPPSLWSFYLLHTFYLAGQGCLVFLLCSRLIPRRPLVAFLAGVFAATWAPLDYHRLNVVQPYAGFTFWTCAAVLMLVESWRRGQATLLYLGALAAFVGIRAYEASAALLLGAPLLLFWVERRPPSGWTWVAAWEALVLLALALAALPLFLPSRAGAYQQQVMGGLDLDVRRVLARLAEQYRYHFFPLVATPPSELATPAVPVALAAYAVPFWLLARRLRARAGAAALPRRREAAALAGLGLALAGLGYAVLVLSDGLVRAARTQFLSAPGVAVCLAGCCALAASLPPPRWRVPLLGVLGAWVVAVGAGRTVALQQFWDQVSLHADQVRLLGRLVQTAPRLMPNTFVILVDESNVFVTTIAFHHALLYLYPGEARGYAWRKWDLGYPTRLTPEGIEREPWPVIREAWREPATRHRYDEVLVFRHTAAGALLLLDDWPAGVLPPLPPGARYDPRSRIVQGAPPQQRRILGDALLP